MTDITHSALIPLPAERAEIALPEALVERAKDYMAEALSERTREAYGRWWRVFFGWCESTGGTPCRPRPRRSPRGWSPWPTVPMAAALLQEPA